MYSAVKAILEKGMLKEQNASTQLDNNAPWLFSPSVSPVPSIKTRSSKSFVSKLSSDKEREDDKDNYSISSSHSRIDVQPSLTNVNPAFSFSSEDEEEELKSSGIGDEAKEENEKFQQINSLFDSFEKEYVSFEEEVEEKDENEQNDEDDDDVFSCATVSDKTTDSSLGDEVDRPFAIDMNISQDEGSVDALNLSQDESENDGWEFDNEEFKDLSFEEP